MSAIAITGATGFLGGALARRLLAFGQPVIALGRDNRKLADLTALGADPVAHDLANGAPSTLRPVAAVVHCAALSSPWGRQRDFETANIAGTRSALAFARTSGAKRFVHISTPSLYFRFRDQAAIREDASLPQPVNAYAATKLRAETLVQEETGMETLILRPRGLYGVGDTALLPRLLRAAKAGPLPLVRNGVAETDLTHVDDAVDAILASLNAPAGLAARVYNVSGGEPLTIRTIAEHAAGRAGQPLRWRRIPASVLLAAARTLETLARLHPGQPEPRITAYGAGLFAFTQTLDLSAAREHLGWTPKVSFEEGLSRTFGQPA